QMTLNISETIAGTHCEGLKFDQKRKSTQWEFPNQSKNPRIDYKNGEFSKQSSFNNTLDLNIKVPDEDDDDGEEQTGE
ncbi:hypothetical protein, partial [Streptomyces sp. CHB19.2]|uniref:hypothetical protein n=1 Tax=Streptomyces sp. CHB19.2 TaxID=2841671 RepID=UPI00209648F7